MPMICGVNISVKIVAHDVFWAKECGSETECRETEGEVDKWTEKMAVFDFVGTSCLLDSRNM